MDGYHHNHYNTNNNIRHRRRRTIIDIDATEMLADGEYPLQESTSLRSIITQFMCFSSIRGVSRIVISQGLGFRIMWSLAVVFLIIMAITHVTYLVIIFCKRDTRYIISTISDKEVPFPTFTMCFSSLLPSHGINYLRNRAQPFNLTPLEYRNRIIEMQKGTAFEGIPADSATGMLLNSFAYYEHVPDDILDKISYSQNSTIAAESCHVFYQSEYSVMRRGPCKISSVKIPGFFGCFQIRPPQKTQYTAHEIEFIVRLDQYDYLNCWQCIPESMRTVRSGVIGKVHPPNILPLMNFQDELHFYPGSSNVITVGFNKYKTMCETETPKNISFRLFGKEYDQPYWPETCIWLVIHQNISNICGCTTRSFVSADNKLALCMNQNLSANNLNLTFIDCVLRLPLAYEFQGPYKKIVLPRETKSCPRPCEYIDYNPSLKIEQLISRHAQLLVYEKLLTENSKIPHDLNLDRILRIRDSGTEDEKREARQFLQSENSVVETLLHIKLKRWSSSAPLLHTEVYIMNVFQFVGQVGGALSVWAGITFVCIVEIVEMIYNILVLEVKRRRFKKLPVEHEIAQSPCEL